MPTVRLIVRYDGIGLSGFQRQRGVPTVQEALETAAAAIACEPIIMRAAGRTDAGVHALAQLVSFRTNATVSEQGWKLGLTSRLPPQVAVLDARFAQDDFDPRRASAGKRYRYLILADGMRDPLLRDRVWHIWTGVDVSRMEREAPSFAGTHDFAAFRAADCERITTKRHLFGVSVIRAWRGDPRVIAIEVEGTAFLKNMVRIIAGTLIGVGRGKLPEGTVRARLEDRDRQRAGMTAPPQGLYLDEVFIKPEWLLPDDMLRSGPAYAALPSEASAEDGEDIE